MGKVAPLLEPCPSEGSSTSPTAPEGDELNKLEERVVAAPEEAQSDECCKKLKEKVVCEKSSESEKPLVSPTRGILDLKLPSEENEKCEDDNFEMSPVDALNEVVRSLIKAKKENDGRVYTCIYCKRQFNSSQALGGHQNAHRQARALAKEKHRVMPPFGHPPPSSYSPYTLHYSSFPEEPSMYGTSSTFNRSLGVRADSMIHKPSPKHMWSTPMGLTMGYRFGQHANPWSAHDASFVDRLRMEIVSQMQNNNNSNNNNNHSFVMAAPSTFQGSGNGVWNFLGVPPNNNDLNPALNNGNGSAGNSSLQAAAINGHTNGNQQPDESSSDLDLDLKL